MHLKPYNPHGSCGGQSAGTTGWQTFLFGKPFATNRADAQSTLDLAQDKNLLIGSAPDTFLGGRWKTVRPMFDRGVIGDVTARMVFVSIHVVELHHSNPDFYYQEGGGPLLDLGPYFLTFMVFLMGPIARVSGMARKTFHKKQIAYGPRNG